MNALDEPARAHACIALGAALIVSLAACAEEPPSQLPEQAQRSAEIAAADPDADGWQYPQTRNLGEHHMVLHAPQIRAWPDFTQFEAVMAIEFYAADSSSEPQFATLTLSGETELRFEDRLVIVTDPVINDVVFAAETAEENVEAVLSAVRKRRLEMPLDIFLASLDPELLEGSPPEGFNAEPPRIHVAYSPTILLSVPGQPFLTPLEETGLQLAVNANWPLIFDPDAQRWFLLSDALWLSAMQLNAAWQLAEQTPPGLDKLDAAGEHAALRAALTPREGIDSIPGVLFSAEPIELIVIDGQPELEEVTESSGLYYARNTASPLFQLANQWYFPVAGRWFVSDTLDDGNWQLQQDLPDAFTEIPEDHELAYLRASIAGTPEARVAALEAILPRKNTITRDATPGIEVSYDGEPDFQPIEQTGVSRAVNSLYDVLFFDGTYYLCHGGAWYQASTPTGPWQASAEVPAAIYAIPPSSPSYAVTDVAVESSDDDNVTYTYTPAYSTSTYVYHGVPVYSTGWYYWPYYGRYYYRYPTAYGYGRYYNPTTGAYGHRATWYGPYGGYSYGERYNPSTGRYGYRETAWDGDDWASNAETYNPRTGIHTDTQRYYSDDKQQASMDRVVSRGDNWVATERTTDFDDGWSVTERETSGGGSSVVERERNEDGSVSTSGTITTGDGRTATISGEFEDGEGSTTITGSEGGEGTITRSVDEDGVTREGEFTNSDGETISSSTQRQGTTTVTELESSEGGQAKSISKGGDRTTVVESSSGDIYAGHNGSVYKKTEDGWESYDPDSSSWQQAESRSRASQETTAVRQPTEESRPAQTGTTRQRYQSRDYSRLERDAYARNQGYNRYQTRRASARFSGRPSGRGGRRR